MGYVLVEATNMGIYPPVFSDTHEVVYDKMRKRIAEIRGVPVYEVQESLTICKDWGWAEKDGVSYTFRIFEVPTQVSTDKETVFTQSTRSRFHEDGICPLCGKEIDYVGAYEHDDDGATLDWQCPSCGASGKAGYTFALDQHYCIQDGEGNEVE